MKRQPLGYLPLPYELKELVFDNFNIHSIGSHRRLFHGEGRVTHDVVDVIEKWECNWNHDPSNHVRLLHSPGKTFVSCKQVIKLWTWNSFARNIDDILLQIK
jgi:hypothetical protein